jgi:tol-pal system protein YbgF
LSSIRALRAENARLENRLTKLEQDKVMVAASRPGGAPAKSAVVPTTKPSPSSNDALPPLTVVKLKPRKDAAPKIETAVEVAEPPETFAQALEVSDATLAAAAQPPDDADLAMADAQFERGLSMMKTGNPEAGISQMQQFVTDWPRHPKADNALYLAGMAFIAEKDFEHAHGLFERVLAQYPAGDAVLDSMLKLAECRVKLNRPREARATWEKIVSGYPGTTAATQAQARLVSQSSQPSTASP